MVLHVTIVKVCIQIMKLKIVLYINIVVRTGIKMPFLRDIANQISIKTIIFRHSIKYEKVFVFGA